ncbi:MAG: radical SAM family heme chaperone HemW [Vicinamibacterales bacterium]
MAPPGIYIHVPFCASICRYCNFNRVLFDPVLKERYVAALERDIRKTGSRLDAGRHPLDGPFPPLSLSSPDTLYFGGGTPSLLEPWEVRRLIVACRDALGLCSDAEVTLEANPETVTAASMAGFREAGVNRVSLGVQSFNADELERLGRTHTAARAVEALAEIRASGLGNISLDLMMWLPGQSVEDWQKSLERLTGLAPAHASLYMLELYPNSPLREEMARGGLGLPPDEVACDMYEAAIDTLAASGYEHYEISNFAMPGRRSRHNMKYWTDGDWFGFGCGAHSTIDGVRWKSVSATLDYVEAVAAGRPVAAEVRRLTAQERLEEALFMRLRLVEGVDLREMRLHYAVDVLERYRERLSEAFDAGLVLLDGDVLRLTRRGLLLSNEVMAVFIDSRVR